MKKASVTNQINIPDLLPVPPGPAFPSLWAGSLDAATSTDEKWFHSRGRQRRQSEPAGLTSCESDLAPLEGARYGTVTAAAWEAAPAVAGNEAAEGWTRLDVPTESLPD